MKVLSVSLTLSTFLTLSRAVPLSTNTSLSGRHSGLCDYARQEGINIMGAFIPQCDAHGNFLPQQCSDSTGNCWCVNIITGEEIPNTRTPLGAVPVNCDREFYCPYGWSRFGKQCFVFIDSPKTWAEAEGYCLFEGANLASVHSYEESHFIQALTRGDGHDFPLTWIGGHDAVHLSFWMWSDGTKFRYEYWHRDYSVERAERCLKMNYGFDRKWYYGSCDDFLPFVCAKRI
ncbi:galactose-specific lectin nattectin-like [Epinephelus fuscoguttatus]|uniref:galactose-specific lectin nattectin-like n=1 Tax=Epinephelus fuscoguttatus TaxID=293821 RepID=UPI0020D1724E|nr:galactose-specific lectin nattectin-like [Epinephelus fuscoguttatus]